MGGAASLLSPKRIFGSRKSRLEDELIREHDYSGKLEDMGILEQIFSHAQIPSTKLDSAFTHLQKRGITSPMALEADLEDQRDFLYIDLGLSKEEMSRVMHEVRSCIQQNGGTVINTADNETLKLSLNTESSMFRGSDMSTALVVDTGAKKEDDLSEEDVEHARNMAAVQLGVALGLDDDMMQAIYDTQAATPPSDGDNRHGNELPSPTVSDSTASPTITTNSAQTLQMRIQALNQVILNNTSNQRELLGDLYGQQVQLEERLSDMVRRNQALASSSSTPTLSPQRDESQRESRAERDQRFALERERERQRRNEMETSLEMLEILHAAMETGSALNHPSSPQNINNVYGNSAESNTENVTIGPSTSISQVHPAESNGRGEGESGEGSEGIVSAWDMNMSSPFLEYSPDAAAVLNRDGATSSTGSTGSSGERDVLEGDSTGSTCMAWSTIFSKGCKTNLSVLLEYFPVDKRGTTSTSNRRSNSNSTNSNTSGAPMAFSFGLAVIDEIPSSGVHCFGKVSGSWGVYEAYNYSNADAVFIQANASNSNGHSNSNSNGTMGEIRADGTRRRPPRALNLVHGDDEEEDADDSSAYQTYSLEGSTSRRNAGTSSHKGDVKGFVGSSGIANAYLNTPLQEGDALSLVLDLSANGSLTSLVGNRTTSTNRNADNGLTLIDAAMSVNSSNASTSTSTSNGNTSSNSSSLRHSGCCHLLRNGELIYTFKGLDLEKRYVLGCHVGDAACVRIVKEKLYRSVNIGGESSSRHARSNTTSSNRNGVTSSNSNSIRMNGAERRLYDDRHRESRDGHDHYNADTDTVEGVYVQSWRQSQQASRLTNSLRHTLSNNLSDNTSTSTTPTGLTSSSSGRLNDNLTLDMLQELARQELGMSLNRSPQLNRPQEPPRPNAHRVRQGQLLLDELQLQRQQLASTRNSNGNGNSNGSISNTGLVAGNDELRRSLETLQARSVQEYLRTSQEREREETKETTLESQERREESKSESKNDDDDSVSDDVKGDAKNGAVRASIAIQAKEASVTEGKEGGDSTPAADSKYGDSEKSNVRDKEPWCCICLTNDKSVLLLPCRHLCVCPDCGLNESALLEKCPICRSTIEHRFRVFT